MSISPRFRLTRGLSKNHAPRAPRRRRGLPSRGSDVPHRVPAGAVAGGCQVSMGDKEIDDSDLQRLREPGRAQTGRLPLPVHKEGLFPWASVVLSRPGVPGEPLGLLWLRAGQSGQPRAVLAPSWSPGCWPSGAVLTRGVGSQGGASAGPPCHPGGTTYGSHSEPRLTSSSKPRPEPVAGPRGVAVSSRRRPLGAVRAGGTAPRVVLVRCRSRFPGSRSSSFLPKTMKTNNGSQPLRSATSVRSFVGPKLLLVLPEHTEAR